MLFSLMWMSLKNIMLSEMSQMEEVKYYMISLTCGTLKRVQMNVYAKLKQNSPQGRSKWDKLGV